MIVVFKIWTKHATYGGRRVQVVDPTSPEQLEAGARKAANDMGLQGGDVTAFRAEQTNGVSLAEKTAI